MIEIRTDLVRNIRVREQYKKNKKNNSGHLKSGPLMTDTGGGVPVKTTTKHNAL